MDGKLEISYISNLEEWFQFNFHANHQYSQSDVKLKRLVITYISSTYAQ